MTNTNTETTVFLLTCTSAALLSSIAWLWGGLAALLFPGALA